MQIYFIIEYIGNRNWNIARKYNIYRHNPTLGKQGANNAGDCFLPGAKLVITSSNGIY